MKIRVGVLALQGNFAEHVAAFHDIGCATEGVKTPEAVSKCDALVIPGGESTTIGKLCERFGVGDAILELHNRGGALWGTCAGMILLAKEIEGNDQWRLGLMDMAVRRNAFGRQVDSFEADLEIAGLDKPTRGVFIRAPYVTRVWDAADVICTFRDKTVAVRQDRLLATAFHPELTADRAMQRYFLEMVQG